MSFTSASASTVLGHPDAISALQATCAKKRPPHLLRNALASVAKYCEPGVPRPFPYPDLSALPDCEMGIFIDSALTEPGEAMVRQALELSVRLEIDGRHVGNTPDTTGKLTPVMLQSLIAACTFDNAKAEMEMEHIHSLLAALNEVASVCFQMLLVTEPSAMGTTELGAECKAALAAAGVKADACVSPGPLYREMSIRLVTLEQDLIKVYLDRLRADLHLQRLQMLQTVSGFLSAQAKRILEQEFLGSDDFVPGEHLTEIELTQCAESPFTATWPQRFFYREERLALRQQA